LGGNAGRAKVYKVRGTRAYIKKLEGTVRRGYTVRINRSDSKVSATGSSIQGFFGLAFIDQLDDKPFVFAGDYKFQLSNISWLSGLDLKAGLLYWGQSVAFGDFSILELSGAVEKKLTTLSQIDIYAGGRFGYARSEYTVSILGTSVSDSGGDLFIAPYVGASYPINAQFSAGAELRIPYYLDDNYDFFDVVYLLAMVEYRL
ncbi:MAG: hypothetical protein KDD33_12705, partial [Bdellovibrionales bacterium]|nr:hypothetical protein [Bdellovibrionales bacterium]